MLADSLRVDPEDRVEGVEDVSRIVDADAQVQETVDALLEHMDDSSGPRRIVELTDHEHDMVYAGPSSYPLYEYKRPTAALTPSRPTRSTTASAARNWPSAPGRPASTRGSSIRRSTWDCRR